MNVCVCVCDNEKVDARNITIYYLDKVKKKNADGLYQIFILLYFFLCWPRKKFLFRNEMKEI